MLSKTLVTGTTNQRVWLVRSALTRYIHQCCVCSVDGAIHELWMLGECAGLTWLDWSAGSSAGGACPLGLVPAGCDALNGSGGRPEPCSERVLGHVLPPPPPSATSFFRASPLIRSCGRLPRLEGLSCRESSGSAPASPCWRYGIGASSGPAEVLHHGRSTGTSYFNQFRL